MDKLTEAMLADGWIKHDGGTCPVHPHAKVGVIIRGFNRNHICQLPGGPDEAGSFEWQHNPSTPAADIIAYKQEQPQ